MVDKIGVNRKWIQDKETSREHFDICNSKREKAIKLGAIPIHFKELAAMTSKRKWKP